MLAPWFEATRESPAEPINAQNLSEHHGVATDIKSSFILNVVVVV